MKNYNPKRIMLFLCVALTMLLLFTACSEEIGDITENTSIVFVGINSPSDAISSGSTDELDKNVKWLADNAESKNIKYVSFLGRFTSAPADTYSDYLSKGLKPYGIIDKNKADTKWMAQFDSLKSTMSVLYEKSLPYGLTYAVEDNFGMGGYRESTYSDIYSADSAIDGNVKEFVKYDEQNYCSVIESNGQMFVVFQLESMPRLAVLDWFNTTMKAYSDHLAIVFTESLIDENGEFWQMWDWTDGYPYKKENRGNTKLNYYNILWTGNPNDGTALWNYALSKHDNLILVVTSNVTSPDKIVAKKVTGEMGNDVALIAGNLTSAENNNAPLIVSISKDNKTVKACYISNGEFIESSFAEVKLEKLAKLKRPVNKDIPSAIGMQPNGANKAYMFIDSEKFEPNKDITRADVIEAVATLIGKHPDQRRDENRFDDIKESDKIYDSVNYLDSQGHLDFIEDGKLSPSNAVTRGELARILYRAANIVDTFSGKITDVSEDEEAYYEYGAIISSGYMSLDDNGKFNPTKKVSRAEFVSIINKVTGFSASEKTIDASLLDNTYTDIAKNPMKYEILAATNSNIEAPYHKDIRVEGVTETEDEFIFENKLAIITVEKKNADVVSIVNKKTGENVLFTAGSLVEIDSPATRSNYPSLMEKDGNRFKFTFSGGEVIYMIIEAHDTFFTFELDTELPLPETSLSFACFDTAMEFSEEPNSIRLSGTLMNTNTFTEYYGGGDAKVTGASVTKGIVNTMGAKYGVVVSAYSDFVKAMQDLADDIDPTVGLVNKVGGAYSTASPSNYGDYCIVSSIEESSVGRLINLALKYNLKQIDLHQGTSSFIQGDYIEGEGFRFKKTKTGTPREFKALVSNKFHKAGLELGLHIYSFYISPDADNTLSNPKYQKQLEYSEVFTLAEDISNTKARIKTIEVSSKFDLKTSFTYKNSKYILVDEEIMLVQRVNSDSLTVTRGQCGTKKTEHKAGAKVYHLIQYYGMFAPMVPSDLFYDMARWVAETYNKGGFDMIYFDAHDGLSKHTSDTWYYGAEFIREVLEHCEKPPIVEHSAQYPTLWAGRSRLIAWDTATRAYKQFNQNHLNTNITWMQKMYPTTFGWFNYAPDSGYPEKNTIAKTLFKDDIDHMGSLAIAWNISTVYNGFESVASNPIMAHNVEYYNIYNKLRLDDYFSEKVKQQIREGKYEYKLEEKADGSYSFREISYSKSKIYNAADDELKVGSANNPFGEQTPFIRIESRYSTEFENEEVLLKINESLPVSSIIGKRENLNLPNLTNLKALKVRVKGNNSKTDAIMITLSYTGPGIYEYTDYVIPLDFEGWKDIILVDSDCGEYGYTFSNRNVNAVSWDIFREVPNYSKINGIEITATGGCNGARMGDIVAYKQTPAPVKNPSITLDGKKITFNTEIKGGEYIEFDPATGKAELNHNNGKVEPITYTGSIKAPTGEFEFTYSATPTTDAPVRAQVVLGFKGAEIANN